MNSKQTINKFLKDYKKIHSSFMNDYLIDNMKAVQIINAGILNEFIDGTFEDTLIKKRCKEIFQVDELECFDNNVNEILVNFTSKYSWSLLDSSSEHITPDIIGKVFEKYINQRENGAYYTDDETIKYIVKRSLYGNIFTYFGEVFELKNIDESFENFISNMKYENLERLLSYLNNIKIYENSVGTGAFLVNLIDILMDAYILIYNQMLMSFPIEETLKNIVNKNIFANDIMPEAVEICKTRVMLKIIQIIIKNNLKLDIYENIDMNIKCFNSLSDSPFEKFELLNKEDKFDLIIGNPPYVEKRKIKSYSLPVLKTVKAGNLYAYFIERASNLLSQRGTIGYIVPISIVSTPRMNSLRNYIFTNFNNIWIANFADRPSSLFNGVHQKVSIIFLFRDINETRQIVNTTSYMHWYSSERLQLLENLGFTNNNNLNAGYIPKLGTKLDNKIYKKLISGNKKLEEFLENDTRINLYLNMRVTFWVKCFYEEQQSAEYKKLCFENEDYRDLFYLILNSDIYFYFWEIISDGWHITNKELNDLMINELAVQKLNLKYLKKLASDLRDDLDANKEYIGSKQIDFIYKTKKSKLIINEINRFLAPIFNLKNNDIERIENYNIKYRLNDEYENYKRKVF